MNSCGQVRCVSGQRSEYGGYQPTYVKPNKMVPEWWLYKLTALPNLIMMLMQSWFMWLMVTGCSVKHLRTLDKQNMHTPTGIDHGRHARTFQLQEFVPVCVQAQVIHSINFKKHLGHLHSFTNLFLCHINWRLL